MYTIYVLPIYDAVWFGIQVSTFRNYLRLPSLDYNKKGKKVNGTQKVTCRRVRVTTVKVESL
jgi:hypothetical protein